MADPQTLLSRPDPSYGRPARAADFTLPSSPVEGAQVVEPGFLYGRYRVEACLGVGGMGAVYRASDPVLGRSVALKAALRSPGNMDVTDGLRFLREAEVLAKLNHPHIVGVHDLGMHGETPFIVLEYLEGSNLRSLLDDRKHLDLDAALRLLVPVVAAIAHAHTQGILHLDLKPSNIFLSPDAKGGWCPKILDFGVCQLSGVDSELDPTREGFAGTPAYCSPEAISSGARTPASDQFSLGVILYEALSGLCPFAHCRTLPQIRNAIIERQYPKLQSLVPSLPEGVYTAIQRSLDANPAQRFPSVNAFALELLAAAPLETRVRWTAEFADA